MAKAHFTDITIRNLPVPQKGQALYFDDTLPSFGIRVSQGGTRTWLVVHGPRREFITIGRYPVISLSAARNEAKRILAEKTLGKSKPATIRFEIALDLFLSESRTKNKPRTTHEYEWLLRRYFLPEFARRPLEEISSTEVAHALDRINGAPVAAGHALVAAKVLFNWARRRGYLSQNPCEMMTPARMVPRDRVLADEELRGVLSATKTAAFPFGAIVLLLLLTGQRRNEIASLRHEQIDRRNRTITLPPAITKNRRQHTFPYGDAVAAFIEGLPGQSGLLFPARGKSNLPLSGWSKSKAAFDREIEALGFTIAPWTLHDLRRTFATNLAKLGTPPHVVEKLLNHASGTISGVAAIYNQFQYVDEMRAAIEAWDAKLASLMMTQSAPREPAAALATTL